MEKFDLLVIGAGSGGVRAARIAAGHGARVGIIEERYLGGTCVNVGCVPKKLFSYAAHYASDFTDAKNYGWQLQPADFDWATLRDNKTTEIERLNGIYDRMLENAGVTLIRGHGQFQDSRHVVVGDSVYAADRILIAVGGWPHFPDVPGIEHAISSNEIFYLDQLPERAVVVGGGYIATEFASILHGLGVEVTQLYRRELFLRGFDVEVRQKLAVEMRNSGVDLRFEEDCTAVARQADGRLELTLKSGGTLHTDLLMYATGRKPLLDGLGLENTGVQLKDDGTIKTDALFETDEPGIYALGDVTGGYELTPVALAEGHKLADRLFAGGDGVVDYEFIATAIFSHPNVATVGYSEEAAREQFDSIRVYRSEFKHLRHTLSGRDTRTFMKLIVNDADDRVVGAHMVGDDAGELIQGIAIAMKAGATKAVFDSTIGIHPTAAEEFVTMRTPG